MARHEHRSFDHHHHHNDCHHNHDRHHKHHQQRHPPHNNLARARSLSPLNYRRQQQLTNHGNHHRHNHHSYHLLDHHHRHQHRHERSRSPPVLRHRSSPGPLPRPQQEPDDARGRKGRYRRRTPPSPRHRKRPLDTSHPRLRRGSGRRRHHSCGSLLSSERSLSPSPQRRAASKGSLAHHLLRLLSSSATPNKGRKPNKSSGGVRRNESIYNSWSYRVPRRRNNKKNSGATTDVEPLLLGSEDSVMPRRSSHHISHLQRATHDEAPAVAEAERLRKAREDALEAERRRATAAEEAAERTRRNRLQMELDEAEMRRVRALEQFNEAERQRREMQIEDRLRQLEDQELAAQDPPKIESRSKKCCRTFKILFGILLSLGLIFVFYLIVASIMGQESPLDIFNFDISNDPLLIDIGIRDTGHNVTEPYNVQYPDIKKYGEILEKESANFSIPSSEEKTDDEDYKFDNVVINPFDTSRGSTPPDYESSYEFVENVILNPYDSSVGNSEIVVNYADDRSIHNGDSHNAYDTYGLQPALTSINDRSILYVDSDQDFSPSNTRDLSYMPAFVASSEDGYGNLNFPQINNKRYLNHDHSVASSLSPSSYLPGPITTKHDEYVFEDMGESEDDLTEPHILPPVHISIPIEESFFDDQPIDRSANDYNHHMHTTRVPDSYRTTDSFNRGRPIPTRRTGVSTDWETQDRRRESLQNRPSLEKLEKQIIDTLLELSGDQNNNRRLRVGSRNPPSNTRRRPPTSRPRQYKTPPTTRRRNLGNASNRRPTPLAARPRPPYRPGPPNAGPFGSRGRNLQHPPRGRPYPMHHTRSPRTPHEDGFLNTEKRLKNRNKRGPRNSDYHVPPPEFRYPKSAGNIQDIIEHMTEEEGHSVQSSSRREREMKSGYKVGDQDHILPPTFIKTESSYERSPEHELRNISPRDHKRRQANKNRPNTKPKYRFRENEYDNSKGKIPKYELFEPDDDVLFHSDGSVTHLSDEHPVVSRPAQRERRPKVANAPPSSRVAQSSRKTYGSSVTSGKKRYYKTKPFKVMLDVYPVGEMQQGKYKPKYESRYTIQDEDGSYRDTSRPISREEFHSPENRNPHSDEYLRYDSRDRYSSIDHYSGYNSREKYADEPRHYSSREEYSDSDSRYRYEEQYTSPESRYSSREKLNSPEYRYSSRDYPKSRSPGSYHSREREYSAEKPYVRSEVQSSKGGNQHTITLHINLYSKKPYADRDQRRMDVPAPREVSLDIPLTRRFTAVDVYKALTQHVRRDSPYAQFLASNREGKTHTDTKEVKLFDLEEGTALLDALEAALNELNPALPSELQFSLPSSAPQHSSQAKTEALPSDRIKRMLENPSVESLDYTDGFSAIPVDEESRNAVDSVEVNTEINVNDGLSLESNIATTDPVVSNSDLMEASSFSNSPVTLPSSPPAIS